MAEIIYAGALTTLQRIKDIMAISANDKDAVLIRKINSATDYIENECNRTFKQATYTNEIYSIWGEQLEFLPLKQMHVTALSSLQYRAGTPANPTWVDFNANWFELVDDGETGLVKIYGGFSPMLYSQTNALRATYTAGYLIDWANAGDKTKHNLPADLTELCERLVIRWWKRRDSGGKSSEGVQGSNITWKDLLDSEDLITIKNYSKPPSFV